jgi:hypothetical protein
MTISAQEGNPPAAPGSAGGSTEPQPQNTTIGPQGGFGWSWFGIYPKIS